MHTFIYLIRLNGKPVYVGFTSKTSEMRWKEHCLAAARKSPYVFHRAIRKYGVDSFSVETIHTGSDLKHTLEVMEPHFIVEHNTHTSKGGYNMTMGGEGSVGFKHTPECIAKMSKDKQGMGLGRIHSEETKEKIRQAHIGKKREPFSAEWLENMSKASKGKKRPPRTEEHCRKISEAQKGKKQPPVTEEARRNMRNANNEGRFKKGHVTHNKGVPSPNKGVPRSDETKANISVARLAYYAAKKGLIS